MIPIRLITDVIVEGIRMKRYGTSGESLVIKAPRQYSLMMPFYCKAEASLSGACEANRIIIEALVIRFIE